MGRFCSCFFFVFFVSNEDLLKRISKAHPSTRARFHLFWLAAPKLMTLASDAGCAKVKEWKSSEVMGFNGIGGWKGGCFPRHFAPRCCSFTTSTRPNSTFSLAGKQSSPLLLSDLNWGCYVIVHEERKDKYRINTKSVFLILMETIVNFTGVEMGADLRGPSKYLNLSTVHDQAPLPCNLYSYTTTVRNSRFMK